MDQLKSLGRRDIFGILLPGTIPIFVGAYLFWGLFRVLDVPVGNILEQEFLVTVILFVTAYFVGSLLRLFAADSVDKKSSSYLLRVWKKENHATVPPEYEEMKNALSKGELIETMPSAFDVWL